MRLISEFKARLPERSRRIGVCAGLVRAIFKSLQGFPVAVFLLFFAGCCDKSEIPDYTRSLYSEAPRDRSNAALQLARCGSNASGAVARLSQLLYDDNVGVQSSAAYALRKIDTKDARAAMDRVEAARRNR